MLELFFLSNPLRNKNKNFTDRKWIHQEVCNIFYTKTLPLSVAFDKFVSVTLVYCLSVACCTVTVAERDRGSKKAMREEECVRGIDTIKKHKSPFQRWASMCICLLVSPQQYTVQTDCAASWVASTHQWSREEDALYGSGSAIHQLPLSKPCSDCPAAQQNQANKPQCTK